MSIINFNYVKLNSEDSLNKPSLKLSEISLNALIQDDKIFWESFRTKLHDFRRLTDAMISELKLNKGNKANSISLLSKTALSRRLMYGIRNLISVLSFCVCLNLKWWEKVLKKLFSNNLHLKIIVTMFRIWSIFYIAFNKDEL